MRIPTEQFARVPVVLLSPGLLSSPESESGGSKNSWLRGTSAVGSAPASPASRRKNSALRSGTPTSTPTMTPVSGLTPISTPSHIRRDVEGHGLEKRLAKLNYYSDIFHTHSYIRFFSRIHGHKFNLYLLYYISTMGMM